MKMFRMVATILFGIAGLIFMTGVGQAKADPYNDMFAAVDFLAKKYQMGTVYTGMAYLDDGTYGETTGRTIIFNASYIEDPAKLNADMVADYKAGFHRGANCSAAQIVAAHETAHVLDNITGHSADYELADAINNGLSGEVSGYSFDSVGDINIDETLAEAFVAVECDTPTSAEKAIYTMLVT